MVKTLLNNSGPYLAIDFGTSAVRATIGLASGAPCQSAREPIPFYKPEDGPDTAWELPPQKCWQTVLKTIAKALYLAAIKPQEIRGLGVSSQRFGLVLMSSSQETLSIIPNRDARSVFQAKVLADTWNSPRNNPACGRPDILSIWPKLLWFKENIPSILDKTTYVAGISDWLSFKLTGDLTLNRTLASEAGLVHPNTGEIVYPPCELGLKVFDAPLLKNSPAPAGLITRTVAQKTGLNPNTPVVNCGPDTQTALLGMGVYKPGQVGITAGWSTSVQKVTEVPLEDTGNGIWAGQHILPKVWTSEANIGEMGGACDWLASILYPEKPYSEQMKLMGKQGIPNSYYSGVSAHMFHLSRTAMNAGGFIFPVPISFEPPSRATLVQSFFKNCAFAISEALTTIEKTGGTPNSLAIAGGMTRLPIFVQQVAAATARPVQVVVGGESAVLGILSLTAVVCDTASLEDLADVRAEETSTVESSALETAHMGEIRETWKRREECLNGAL